MRITKFLKKHSLQLIISNNLTTDDKDKSYIAVIGDLQCKHPSGRGNDIVFVAHGKTPFTCMKMLLKWYAGRTAIRTTDQSEIKFPKHITI